MFLNTWFLLLFDMTIFVRYFIKRYFINLVNPNGNIFQKIIPHILLNLSDNMTLKSKCCNFKIMR